MKTSCGCTTAKLAKRTFAPGEEGQLTVTFAFGSRTGEQIKTITVQTTEPNSRPKVLTMKVTIPDFATITPRYIFWNRDEEAAAKSVRIGVGALGPVTVTAVRPQNEQIQAELVPLKAEDGSRFYEVLLTPQTTQAPLETNIRIDVKAESGQSKTLWVRAAVLRGTDGLYDAPPVTLNPRAVIWKVGDKPEPKTILVEGDPGELQHALSGDEQFDIEIKAIVAGKTYAVVVTPKSTAAPGKAIIAVGNRKDEKTGRVGWQRAEDVKAPIRPIHALAAIVAPRQSGSTLPANAGGSNAADGSSDGQGR